MPRTIKVPKELSKAVVEKKKATPKEKVEKKKVVPKEKVEKNKVVPKAKVEKKAVPKDKVEKKKAVPKAKVEKKKAVPKDKVEKKKVVPKVKVDKKKAVPKEKVEKKKAVHKEKVEKKKAVPKVKVDKKKAVPKEKVEKKKAVPKVKVDKKKAVPKENVEKRRAVPKVKVDKKKVSPKVSKGGKVPYATFQSLAPKQPLANDANKEISISTDIIEFNEPLSKEENLKMEDKDIIETLYTHTLPTNIEDYPEIADNGMSTNINKFNEPLPQEGILEMEDFNKLFDDPTEADVIKELGINLEGGKKTIKHIRKPKYGKKYRGGDITAKLSKLKEMIASNVFGITINIPAEDNNQISEETITFRRNIKTIAKSSVVERQLEADKQESLLNMFVRAINKDQKLDRLAKSFRAKKIIEYACEHNEILTTFKNKHESQNLKSIEYVNPDIFNKLFRPNTNKVLYIYGMQLPHQFDRVRLLGTIYKLHNKQIYSIVDLQDCNGGLDGDHPRLEYGVGCNPFDRDCEFDLWSVAISSIGSNAPPSAKYTPIEYIDMSTGSLKTWYEISQIKETNDEKNKTVIHCLAGAGRTGCVMLYLLMRDFSLSYGINIDSNIYISYLKDKIKLPFFGFANIKEFIEKELFCYFHFVEDDDDLDNNKKSVKHMLSELFDTSGNLTISGTRASLFRKRLNYIIVFISKHFSITEFVTYHENKFKILDDVNKSRCELITVDITSPTNLDYEFIKPYKKTIKSWNNYKIEEFMENEEDNRYKEVMSWIN
jgi:hypothetical protein